MNEVGFCPVVSGDLSCGVLSVWGFVRTPAATGTTGPKCLYPSPNAHHKYVILTY